MSAGSYEEEQEMKIEIRAYIDIIVRNFTEKDQYANIAFASSFVT